MLRRTYVLQTMVAMGKLPSGCSEFNSANKILQAAICESPDKMAEVLLKW
jgi:hypothetical protein